MARIPIDSRVQWGVVIPQDEPVHGPNERCIELPLAMEVVDRNSPGFVLDAGCALNGTVHQLGTMAPSVVHLTQNLSSEKVHDDPDQPVSYVSCDVRKMAIFADRAFARTVCVSTLEHVGMDNGAYHAAAEHRPESIRYALKELCRVTRDRLFLTVPFADPPVSHRAWRFLGPEEIGDIVTFLGEHDWRVSLAFYAHTEGGWYGGGAQPVEASPDGFPHKVNAIACLLGVR